MANKDYSGIAIKKLREKNIPSPADVILAEDSNDSFKKVRIPVGSIMVPDTGAPTVANESNVVIDPLYVGTPRHRSYLVSLAAKYVIADFLDITAVLVQELNNYDRYTIFNTSPMHNVHVFSLLLSQYIYIIPPNSRADFIFYGGAHEITSDLPLNKLEMKPAPHMNDLVLLEDSENNYQKVAMPVSDLLAGIAPRIITDSDIVIDGGNIGTLRYRFFSMDNSIKYLITDLTTTATINLPPMSDGQQYKIYNSSDINEIYLFDAEGSTYVTALLPGKIVDMIYYGGTHYPNDGRVLMTHATTSDATPTTMLFWDDSFIDLRAGVISSVTGQINVTDNTSEHAIIDFKAKFLRVNSNAVMMVGGAVIDKWATVNLETVTLNVSTSGNMLTLTLTGVDGMSLFTKGFLTVSTVNTLN